MKTPICDFVRSYADKNAVRLHMPGHKGEGLLGFEAYDITEIRGADSLYEANGIIKESEEIASMLFGAETFYSTEGSSLAIRAMLYLACLSSYEKGVKPLILAGRNAHKAFVSSAALLDFEIEWIYPLKGESYFSCVLTAQEIDDILTSAKVKPTAVYLTSPDYLGNESDVRGIASVCRKHGVLFLVDNAHGAYLRFLPESRHPIELGADACCDSAHKTLPVLTGGAYLHLSKSAPSLFNERAREALRLFGSTSPSYLILQSLDAANDYLGGSYKSDLAEFIVKVSSLKERLVNKGYNLIGTEEMKITIDAKSYGYRGYELSQLLENKGVFCEFSDSDFVVLMLTPQVGKGLDKLENALFEIRKKQPVKEKTPLLAVPKKVMSVRKAYFMQAETIDIKEANGRVLAVAAVGCPPAVPIVVSGEVIAEDAISCFEYYGIDNCRVVK